MNEGGEGDRRDGNQQLVSTLACRQGCGINRTKKNELLYMIRHKK